ncbi:MAG: shikimate dehydrogenase [Betaproteobacteria bacterium RIFCSPLOWO2_02_FULL_67_26]|nr:MAG: shikimate dehydrogenase [Betaproteobacteria bacterium RIFCSPLOWO2_02_FULL_67_26]
MSDQYAVIGNPVEHSLSPAIHAEFGRATGEDIAYGRILAPLDGFRTAALRFRDEGGRGLNITLPFKPEAWRLADSHSAGALVAGAVNALKFEGGRIAGHNTDGIGLARDLKDNLGCTVRGGRVLLMGAGGASYGVMEPLLRELPQSVVVANRTVEKAKALIGHFAKLASDLRVGRFTWLPYDRLTNDSFDIVINATSASLKDGMPPLPREVFAPGALAYDMVYGRDTPFMTFAAGCGARAADGLGMLVEQAAESFFIWRGVRPATGPVIRLLRQKGKRIKAKGGP